MAPSHCYSCGEKIDETDAFCSRCGAENYAAAGIAAGQPGYEADSTARMETCSDCGKEVSSRAPFCPNCGAPHGDAPTIRAVIKPDWGIEWRSKLEIMGFPLIHVAIGRKNGKLLVAKGIIAIGQFAIGLITLAQFGVGFLFGFGQFIFGFTAIAQFAIGVYFGLGQIATGYIAIGQFAFGFYALGQIAIGKYIWMPDKCDPEAREFFLNLVRLIGFRK